MDKRYQPDKETDIYKLWEKKRAFTPIVPANPTEAKKKHKPFTIILPPPNANDPLHAGHALYVVEDIMIRFHRMLGDPTLWLPGTDHAGIETQFVFEKHLTQKGKSRFDYDRQTLFQMIANYVNKNRGIAVKQMKRLGFSLDWTRERFTLDPAHTKRIFAVFKKMYQDGLIYRDEQIVNYCTHCGTAFSNLEVIHKQVNSHLWYFKYPLIDNPKEFIEVATTRPETMLGDTAVAIHPKDPRYQKYKGKKILLPIINKEIPIIFDKMIDPDFGTGAVKVTPAHSPEDFQMAKTHHLNIINIINFDGKFNNKAPKKYRGFYATQVRKMVIEDMDKLGFLSKVEDYSHQVGHCYRCHNPIEPLLTPQLFVKIKPLADKAVEAVKQKKTKFFPQRFQKNFFQWMDKIRDWPISRQIIWGHRIPIWYNLDERDDFLISFVDDNKKLISSYWLDIKKKYDFDTVKKGLQSIIAPAKANYYLSEKDALKHGPLVLQETDTFDTWFSSAQWPYSTLGWQADGQHSPDFEYFYPTTVLDTMWDILFFWVARMIMIGIYATGQVPFEIAHMHSRVNDLHGKKMSKSKGNVIEPIKIAEEFGADALRMALVYGVAPASDIALSTDKIRAQRNFVNKIWNASRFVNIIIDRFQQNHPNLLVNLPSSFSELRNLTKHPDDLEIIADLEKVIKSTTKNLKTYRFGQASEDLYQFFWHQFCDSYIEKTKDKGVDVIPVLVFVLINSLKLLHPFIPFVTESIYQNFKQTFAFKEGLLATSSWPKTS